ncbi:hypothetical protein B0H16DRAFT_1686265, partial [Mycena metata]
MACAADVFAVRITRASITEPTHPNNHASFLLPPPSPLPQSLFAFHTRAHAAGIQSTPMQVKELAIWTSGLEGMKLKARISLGRRGQEFSSFNASPKPRNGCSREGTCGPRPKWVQRYSAEVKQREARTANFEGRHGVHELTAALPILPSTTAFPPIHRITYHVVYQLLSFCTCRLRTVNSCCSF